MYMPIKFLIQLYLEVFILLLFPHICFVCSLALLSQISSSNLFLFYPFLLPFNIVCFSYFSSFIKASSPGFILNLENLENRLFLQKVRENLE